MVFFYCWLAHLFLSMAMFDLGSLDNDAFTCASGPVLHGYYSLIAILLNNATLYIKCVVWAFFDVMWLIWKRNHCYQHLSRHFLCTVNQMGMAETEINWISFLNNVHKINTFKYSMSQKFKSCRHHLMWCLTWNISSTRHGRQYLLLKKLQLHLAS